MSPRLLLFDLYTGGHHRHYLEMLARAWVNGSRPGLLEIAAPAALFRDHTDFGDWLAAQDPSRVAAIPVDLPATLKEGAIGLRSVLSNDLTHGRILAELLKERNPEHVLAMYFDHVQASLALRRIPGSAAGTQISGIYFRPSFHFPEESALTRLRKRRLLQAALTHAGIHRVLTLDPFAVEALSDPRVVWLPDGFNPAAATVDSGDIRARWQVDPTRSVLLFFGVVSGRKGIHEILEALPRMPEVGKVALVIAGRIPIGELASVKTAMERARVHPAVQIIHDDRYIREEEVQDMFRASDAALVAYQRHTGSSNVLIRAAATGVPVIGSNYGLMGRLIPEHGLGLAVNTTDPDALAHAMSDGASGQLKANEETARSFAAANTAERFTETVFREILSEETGQ